MAKVLLFIPAYNCSKQVVRVLDKIDSNVLKYINEIIVVNNRSTDDTEQVVIDYKNKKEELPLKVLRNDLNYSLGGSHKVAFEYAITNNFDYVIVLHGDDQGSILDLVPYLESGEYTKYDCFLGARFMKNSKLEGYSKVRTFVNIAFNKLFSIVTKKKILDLGSGLNIYSTNMLKSRFYYRFPDRLTFNYCMILAASYYNHNIHFFPITWKESDQKSNVKSVRQGLEVLKILFKYMFKKTFITKELRDKSIDKYTYKEIK